MKSIRSMFFMFTIFFLFIANGLACNSYQLNQIKNNVESQKDTLSLRNYNYNYLTQTKNELLNEKKFLTNCLHNGVKELLNIQTLLKNPDNVSKSEQQHLEFIQQNTKKKINIIHYNLNQINHLIILVDDRLNFAKDYTDSRNQQKDIVHLIN